MEKSEIRNNILMELIDKMQSQMADKAYPEEKKEETAELPEKGEKSEPKKLPESSEAPERSEDDEELLEELMKQREVE